MKFIPILFLSLVLSLTAACQSSDVVQLTVPPSTTPNLVTSTPPPAPTQISSEPATAVPTRIAPTATTPPANNVSLRAPDFLAGQVNRAIQEFNATQNEWFIVSAAGDQEGQIMVVEGEAGISLGNRPLAIAVPFTWPWDAVTAEEAQDILISGSPGVQILDKALLVPSMKALKVDGLNPYQAGYPLSQPWSIVAEPGYDEAARQFADSFRPYLNDDRIVRLTAVGDIMLDRALGYAIRQGNTSYPFALVEQLLQSADITVGNLESALGDTGQPAAKSYTFQAPPEAAQTLSSAGFDVLSLANNHAMDFGPESLLQAIELLQNQSVHIVGAGGDELAARRPVTIEIDDLKVAFLGYVNVPVEVTGFDTRTWSADIETPGLAWAEPDSIAADVAKAKSQADLVVVLLHSGYEYVDPPSPEQSANARAAIAAGADLVIGHHAHVLQGVEFDEAGVIVYGLGNFAFEIDGDPSTAILNVWLDKRGVRQLEFIPAIIQFGGQPRFAEAYEIPSIFQRIYNLTNALGSG